MTTKHLVRWVLTRGVESVTCQINVRGRRSNTYEIAVVPHTNVGWGSIEDVKTPWAALHRHAEITNRLLNEGWSVTRHTPLH
jgi:hypothetical protein